MDELFFNNIDDFLFVIALEDNKKPGSFIRINDYALNRLGYSADELMGKNLLDLFDEGVIDKNIKQLARVFTKTALDTTFVTHEGVWIDVSVKTYLEKFEGKQVGLIVAKDLTDLRKAYEELQYLDEELVNQRENFQALIDNLTQTQEQLIQSEKMAALGQLISGIAHEINTPLGAIKASVGNLEDSIQKVTDGIQHYQELLNTDDFEIFKKLLDWPRTLKSLTSREKRKKRKEITETLAQHGYPHTEKLAEIMIYLEIYDDYMDVIGPVAKENLLSLLKIVRDFYSLKKNKQTINIATERAAVVVFALRKFIHHDQSGEMNKADVIEGIETVLTLYHNQIKQGLEIVREYQDVPQILAYHDEINQVWTNLIHNGIQAMSQTGVMTITTSSDDQWVKVAIKDTGMGISPDMKDKIFQPFFTTKKKGEGSGLGLDIVKKIIEKHKGKIYFESMPEKGTTFFVELPIDPTKM